MIKALLIVTALAGGGEYRTEMPSMRACLDARAAITQQDATVTTLCVPKGDETAKMKDFFHIFMNMVDQIMERQEIERLNREENRLCQDCTKSE